MRDRSKTALVMPIIFGLVCFCVCSLILYGIISHTEGGLLRACRGSTGAAFYSPVCQEICWSPIPLPLVVISKNATGDDSEVLQRALESMNDDLGGRFLVMGIGEGSIEIWFNQSPEKGYDPNEGGTTSHWINIDTGCVDAVTVRVINVPIQTMKYAVLRHEIGHALGLDHDDSTNSVMHTPPGKYLSPDDKQTIRGLFLRQ